LFVALIAILYFGFPVWKRLARFPGSRGFAVQRPEYDHSFDSHPFIENLETNDYLKAISKAELSKDQEVYLRTVYWRLMNDPRRRSQSPIALSREEQLNLRNLLTLVDEMDESSRLIRAEIYRELGEFEECAKALDYDFSDDYISVAVTIYMLQEEKLLCRGNSCRWNGCCHLAFPQRSEKAQACYPI
jgi:hypothetical protein